MSISTSLSIEPIKNEFTINTRINGDQTLFDVVAKAGGGFAIIYGSADGLARVEELDAAFNAGDSTTMSAINLPGGDFNVTDASLVQTPNGFLMAVLDVDNQGGGMVAVEFGRNQNGELTFPDDFIVTGDDSDVNPDAAALTNGDVVTAYLDDGTLDAVAFLLIDPDTNSTSDNFQDFADDTDVAVAALEGGGFVMAWTQGASAFGNSGTRGEIVFQLHDATGAKIGGPVEPYVQLFAGDIEGVELIGLPGGGFAMAIDDGEGVVLQVFNAAGTNLTPNGFTIAGRNTDAERDLSLSLIDDNYILLSYTFPFNGSAVDEDVRGQLFELDGSVASDTFGLAASGAGERDALVAGSQTGDGFFLTAFTDELTTTDGSGSAVRGTANQIVRTHQGDFADDNFFNLEFTSEPDIRNDYRDVMRGGGGADFLAGFGGRDDLFGDAGNDILFLFEGDDAFGSEILSGGADLDTLRFIAVEGGDGVFDLTNDTVSSIEIFQFQPTSTTTDMSLTLNADQMEGGSSKASEIGVIGANGSKAFTFTINANEGSLNLRNLVFDNFGDVNDKIVVNVDDVADIFNVVTDSNIDDEINGSDGNDFISVGEAGGTDTVLGGSGTDVIGIQGGSGGATNETFDGGADTDTLNVFFSGTAVFDFTDDTLQNFEAFQFAGNDANVDNARLILNSSQLVTVDDAKVANFSINGEFGTDSNTVVLNVDEAELDLSNVQTANFEGPNSRIEIHGRDTADNITGSNFGEEILGGGGSDIIRGGQGADTLRGGAGDDELRVADGDMDLGPKTFDGGADTDTLVFGTGASVSETFDVISSTILSIELIQINDPGPGATTTLQFSSNQFGGGGVARNAVFSFDGFDDNFEIIQIDMQTQKLDLSALAFSGSTTAARFEVEGDDHEDHSIIGSDITDHIVGGDGLDTIRSGGGSDLLQGGQGNDRINSGEDADTINGDEGDDLLFGLGGGDLLDGGANNDTIFGGDGADTILGGGGNDRVLAGRDNDSVTGSSGDDVLRGAGGDDTLDGGNDNDVLLGQAGDDLLVGGLGDDTISAGGNDDFLSGGDGEDVMRGEQGNDVLNGGDDRDRMFGGIGFDTINGDGGNDVIRGEEGSDSLNGGFGEDLLLGGDGNDTLGGSFDNDRLFGEGNRDFLDGGPGDDTLVGGAAADTLIGGPGADRFEFGIGDGNDTILDFDLANDTLEFTGQTQADISIVANGGDALIRYDGGSVTLDGIDSAALDPSTFEFG